MLYCVYVRNPIDAQLMGICILYYFYYINFSYEIITNHVYKHNQIQFAIHINKKVLIILLPKSAIYVIINDSFIKITSEHGIIFLFS